jgi:hypothetical protein
MLLLWLISLMVFIIPGCLGIGMYKTDSPEPDGQMSDDDDGGGGSLETGPIGYHGIQTTAGV